jgi:ELWxxDGT repeat protein
VRRYSCSFVLLALVWHGLPAHAQTVARVKDINTQLVPGSVRQPSALAELGGALLFSATDDGKGAELWRSEGPFGFSSLVKDIVPGPGSSHPKALRRVGNVVFFTVTTPSGPQLWKTDGTGPGTVFVKSGDPRSLA